MISILIATYQWDTEALVKSLVKEISESNIVAEIICYDDASGFEQSKEFMSLPYLNYRALDSNIGRSVIRNLMAKEAKYSLLLFLDADSLPKRKDFLQNYLTFSTKYEVVCGGTAYYPNPPTKKNELLRWVYGWQREQRLPEDRIEQPYFSFTSNNFLIKKSVFESQPFDEKIKKYGHEDTLFGLGLRKNGVKIGHIDNPVYHLGLDDGDAFLKKTVDAIENLVDLYNEGKVGKEVKLIRMYLKLKRIGLIQPFNWYFRLMESRIRQNLVGFNPKLRNLDILKLGYFCQQV